MKYAKEAHKPGSDHESPRSTQCLHLLLRPRRCSPSVYLLLLLLFRVGGGGQANLEDGGVIVVVRFVVGLMHSRP